VGNDHIAIDRDPFLLPCVDDTIFLDTRPTTNGYSSKIATQNGTCPDKTVIRYLHITDDDRLRMDIGGFGDFGNLFFKLIDRHDFNSTAAYDGPSSDYPGGLGTMTCFSYRFFLRLNPLMIRAATIKPINAIAQNEAKLSIPVKKSVFQFMACSKWIERGTMIPTKTDKTRVVLKDLKSPFPLFILFRFH
jgi:hypothetical protein